MSGTSVDHRLPKSQLPTSFGKPQFPDLSNNKEHTILIETPVFEGSVPKSYPSVGNRRDYWDLDHVKLPCSENNLTLDQRKRWDLIKEALTKSQIRSVEQLEAAIKSYNIDVGSQWKFTTLKLFFKEIIGGAENKAFFDSLLPKIIDLALRLPELITSGIPLLKRDRTHSISLSQLQVGCLLANAFLCTYPCRNDGKKKNVEYRDYPTINLNELFQCDRNSNGVLQKIRCLLHYFKRITDSAPTGVITFSRNYIAPSLAPRWFASERTLSRLFVSAEGNIEDDGYGLYQMDFADKFIGGLITTTGCVQEEIRFSICPELIITRLFTECIGPGEAVIITGCERFSNYRGYGPHFKWTGNHEDSTPCDEYGRRYCTVLALDAMNYRWKPAKQYTLESISRELNKAYAGFSWGSSLADKTELCAVATGNWGCGIFRGNVQLKSLLQLMAASEAGRDLAYFTFKDVKLQNSMAEIHLLIVKHGVTLGNLYKFIVEFCDSEIFKSTDLFAFLKSRIGTGDAGTASGSKSANV